MERVRYYKYAPVCVVTELNLISVAVSCKAYEKGDRARLSGGKALKSGFLSRSLRVVLLKDVLMRGTVAYQASEEAELSSIGEAWILEREGASKVQHRADVPI